MKSHPSVNSFTLNFGDVFAVFETQNFSVDEYFDENDVLEESDNFGSVNFSFKREKWFHW